VRERGANALRICTTTFIGPKPVQKPPPPIYLAMFSPPTLERVATEADDWFPVGIPISGLVQMFERIKGMTRDAGRDPAALELIVRANLEISDATLGSDRTDFTGTLEQIAADVVSTRKLGAADLLFDV
jgi:hypothetical protein